MRSIRRLRFTRPAEPISTILAEAFRQACEQVPGIAEAWLPDGSINGEPARPLLVVGIADGRSIPEVMEALMPKVRLLTPPREVMDILPFPVADLPHDARIPQCRLYVAKAKPWWKVW